MLVGYKLSSAYNDMRMVNGDTNGHPLELMPQWAGVRIRFEATFCLVNCVARYLRLTKVSSILQYSTILALIPYCHPNAHMFCIKHLTTKG